MALTLGFRSFGCAVLVGAAIFVTQSGTVHATAPDNGCWTRAAAKELASRASLLDSAVARLGDVDLKVCYSRPSARGRVIMGGLVPFGEPWRLGANEATALHVPVAVRVGDVTLQPGVYSLYAIPGAQNWQIVVNSSATRWGIPIGADVRTHDVGTVTVTGERTDAPVETLTMRLEAAGEGALALVIEWERTRVRLPIRRAQ
jgi:hypothetical protein